MLLRPLCLSVALLLPFTAPAQAERAQQGLLALFAPAQKGGPDRAARAELKAAVKVAMANPPRGRIWCVPFARAVSGVEIRGNARTWWDQARGRYARGHEPKVGAVMAFAASRSMPKGHVAVVSKVIDDRTVLVDQANWERNRITLDTVVVDVSAKGDWSKVRVANGAGSLGRVNPVKGFIYAE
ncbi:CHAP domain-containing protein [Tabrizicola sp. TH137]|uniref:CHAP domain-containing protein n=1 Tax=Tabrizicola sp. TH137 TaxID=2067452 RepID=UPI001C1F85EF|nr:CHAP domain-containing protein [Tabrizicola sp. TH137]